MAKVWNITCKLCLFAVDDSKNWKKDQSGASYHKTCYETAIRLMARSIAEHQKRLERSRHEEAVEVQDDPDHHEIGRNSPAVGLTARMLDDLAGKGK